LLRHGSERIDESVCRRDGPAIFSSRTSKAPILRPVGVSSIVIVPLPEW
jgi:hypothetical protein